MGTATDAFETLIILGVGAKILSQNHNSGPSVPDPIIPWLKTQTIQQGSHQEVSPAALLQEHSF